MPMSRRPISTRSKSNRNKRSENRSEYANTVVKNIQPNRTKSKEHVFGTMANSSTLKTLFSSKNNLILSISVKPNSSNTDKTPLPRRRRKVLSIRVVGSRWVEKDARSFIIFLGREMRWMSWLSWWMRRIKEEDNSVKIWDRRWENS